jgi:hypothetical protein
MGKSEVSQLKQNLSGTQTASGTTRNGRAHPASGSKDPSFT